MIQPFILNNFLLATMINLISIAYKMECIHQTGDVARINCWVFIMRIGLIIKLVIALVWVLVIAY